MLCQQDEIVVSDIIRACSCLNLILFRPMLEVIVLLYWKTSYVVKLSTYHYNVIFPSEVLSIPNFGGDLHNRRAFAAAVISHIPSTKSTLAEIRNTFEPATKSKNAKMLSSVLLVQEIGIVYCPPYEFLCEAPPPLQAPAHMHILLSLDTFNTSSCQSL
jgi:hypothetical protein